MPVQCISALRAVQTEHFRFIQKLSWYEDIYITWIDVAWLSISFIRRVCSHLFMYSDINEKQLIVIMFWDIMPCSLLKINLRFGETFRILRKRRNQHGTRTQHRYASFLLSRRFLDWFILRAWRLRWHGTPKCWLSIRGIPGIIFQKREVFRKQMLAN